MQMAEGIDFKESTAGVFGLIGRKSLGEQMMEI